MAHGSVFPHKGDRSRTPGSGKFQYNLESGVNGDFEQRNRLKGHGLHEDIGSNPVP